MGADERLNCGLLGLLHGGLLGFGYICTPVLDVQPRKCETSVAHLAIVDWLSLPAGTLWKLGDNLLVSHHSARHTLTFMATAMLKK